ncbi:hypothetical protein, partial [Acinetobacter sp.]|uniref:hypothetical protein n=1 Tax=Acinetobacter sp. TaxID=472 RepID=UPI0038911482
LKMIEVDSEGGHEGGGEYASITYAIAPEGSLASEGRVEGALAYIHFTGFYSSHDGTEWDVQPQVVVPVDVMVVQYETVSN